MDQKNINEKNKQPDNRLKSFKLIDERMTKRRKASIGKLITYIVALIIVILLWFWFRRVSS
jgi:hypothetical protein